MFLKLSSKQVVYAGIFPLGGRKKEIRRPSGDYPEAESPKLYASIEEMNRITSMKLPLIGFEHICLSFLGRSLGLNNI